MSRYDEDAKCKVQNHHQIVAEVIESNKEESVESRTEGPLFSYDAVIFDDPWDHMRNTLFQ